MKKTGGAFNSKNAFTEELSQVDQILITHIHHNCASKLTQGAQNFTIN